MTQPMWRSRGISLHTMTQRRHPLQLYRHASMWPTMCKSYVIRETGRTLHISTPSGEDRATAVGNIHQKCGDDWTCSFWDMLADRHTHTECSIAITILSFHTWNGVTNRLCPNVNNFYKCCLISILQLPVSFCEIVLKQTSLMLIPALAILL